jgi:hypothetical protein
MTTGLWDGETPPTCREYLGVKEGYCPQPPKVIDLGGRGYCPEHASERAAWTEKNIRRARLHLGERP